jgi:hypothetical protein
LQQYSSSIPAVFHQYNRAILRRSVTRSSTLPAVLRQVQ